MKLSLLLEKKVSPILSLEIIPPQRGESCDDIFETIEELLQFNPSFISVTRHQPKPESHCSNKSAPLILQNKHPGTVGLSAAIKLRYGIETIPHLICGGITKYEIEDLLIDLSFLGFDNVFIIRGDKIQDAIPISENMNSYSYALDLIKQVSWMNKGIYLNFGKTSSKTDFCIGAAVYPEKHFESESIDNDLNIIKQKIALGTEYFISQMFFDSSLYKNFIDLLRNNGINQPVIPGIKPIISEKSMNTVLKTFHVSMPKKFIADMQSAKTQKNEMVIGLNHMVKIIQDLHDMKVPGIHVFTMGKGKAARELLKQVWK